MTILIAAFVIQWYGNTSDPVFYNLAKTILDGLREIKIIKNTE